ncbi:MAG: Gfo/Idh/MocA family protein [Candidatus Neomarinimicrobiota bacterium]
MVSDNSVQVAVIGSGYWGKNLVRNFYQLNALRWICDTSRELLKAMGQIYPGAQLTTRYQDVLEDDQVQAVVIATSPALHFSQAKEALIRGKHVFVEKPLALGYQEGKELVELADRQGLILLAGHILEYHPAVTHLKEIIRQGELGQLWYIYSNRLNLGKVRTEENILWSFAPHDISVILHLAGIEPEIVHASGGSYLQAAIADVTVTNLVFKGGLKAHVFVSWLHPYKEQKLVVIGDRKMAVFDDTVRKGKLCIYDKGIEWQGGVPIPRHIGEVTVPLEDAEPLRIECEHFLACIREGKQPLTDGESALRVLKVLEASQLSLEQEGVPVPLTAIH